MSGQHRLRFGQDHERRVQAELERRGWHVQPWGQGLMDAVVRQALMDRAPVVLWRWIPDMIAVKGNRVALVDPKSELRNDTANFAVEINALQAHRAMSPLGLRIVYVFGDMSCNFPEDLVAVGRFMPDVGSQRVAANGSGTPFVLVRKHDQLPMDKLFGEPLPEQHAS